MFGLGLSEILLILGLALIFIGPERLPDLARSLAKGYSEFRRSFDEVKNTIEKDIRSVDTENLLRQGKAFPLEDFKPAPWSASELPEPSAEALPAPSPYPEEAPSVEAAAPPVPPEPAPAAADYRSAFRDSLKAELKAELRSELLEELRAELHHSPVAESRDER